jgi:hypothetical protein
LYTHGWHIYPGKKRVENREENKRVQIQPEAGGKGQELQQPEKISGRVYSYLESFPFPVTRQRISKGSARHRVRIKPNLPRAFGNTPDNRENDGVELLKLLIVQRQKM